MAQQILRLPQVKTLTGLSRSSIYAAIKRREFPPPLHLSQRTVGWLLSDIENWITLRATQAKGEA